MAVGNVDKEQGEEVRMPQFTNLAGGQTHVKKCPLS